MLRGQVPQASVSTAVQKRLLPLPSIRYIAVNVFLNHVFRYIPYCSGTVSSNPEDPVPLILLFKMPIKFAFSFIVSS